MKYRNQLLHAILKYRHLAFLNTVHATHSHFFAVLQLCGSFLPSFLRPSCPKILSQVPFHLAYHKIWYQNPASLFSLYRIYPIFIIRHMLNPVKWVRKKIDKCWILLQIFYRTKKYIFCICKIQSAIANKNLSHLTNKKVSQF